MDRLSEMQAFVAVVNQGGFTGAASHLGISKSAISKQVSALEARLGAHLLHRTTRRVSPTEVGMLYYDKARKVIDDALEADALVTAHQESPRGRLKITAPVSFGTRHLSPVIARFLCAYRDVSIDLMVDDRKVDIIEGGFDLAVRIGHLEDSALMARKLADTAMSFVASPAYLERFGEPQSLDDLSRHMLLHYSLSKVSNLRRLMGRDGKEYAIRASGPITSNNGDILLEAAISGLGLVHCPAFFVGDALESGALVEVLQEHRQPDEAIYVVYPPGRYVQPKTRAFIDFLVEQFRGVDPYFKTPQRAGPPKSSEASQGAAATA